MVSHGWYTRHMIITLTLRCKEYLLHLQLRFLKFSKSKFVEVILYNTGKTVKVQWLNLRQAGMLYMYSYCMFAYHCIIWNPVACWHMCTWWSCIYSPYTVVSGASLMTSIYSNWETAYCTVALAYAMKGRLLFPYWTSKTILYRVCILPKFPVNS